MHNFILYLYITQDILSKYKYMILLCIVHYALCIMNCALKKNVTARQISLPDGQLYEL